MTYDAALDERYRHVMTEQYAPTGETVNRMLHINENSQHLINKLEATRVVCRDSGCAQRYLIHDALNAMHQASVRVDQEFDTEYHQRLLAYIEAVHAGDLTLGVAMTGGKGDRSLRPHAQPNLDAYVRIKERRKDGIVIRGAKAIITGAPYVHELMVMPCRNMTAGDTDFAVCCAVPVDAENLTIVARPAGRPGEDAAKFSAKYGQSTSSRYSTMYSCPWNACFWRANGNTRSF